MKRVSRTISMTALAIGALAIGGGGWPVLAQDAAKGGEAAQGAAPEAALGPRGAGLFDRMDANGDGQIGLEEFTARSRARFEAMDTDGDGAVSAEEARQMGPAARDGRGGAAAGDRPGRLDGNMSGRRDMQNDGMQRNAMPQGPGTGPGYRMGSGRAMGQERQGGGFGPFGGLQGDGPMGYGGFGDPSLTDEQRAERAQQLVEMLDADGDGKLDVDEMAARPGPQMIFDRIDFDGDGVISQDEFDAALETAGGGFGGMRGNR